MDAIRKYPLLHTSIKISLFFCFPLFLASVSLASTPLIQDSESRLQMVGDSTLHAWHSTATVITAEAVLNGDAKQSLLDQVKAGGLSALTVTIPIEKMESGKGGLDKKMQKTLNAKDHPDITFTLSDYTLKKSTGAVILMANGQLTVSGTVKDITLETTVDSKMEKLHFSGSQDLLMTDFNIDPPKMMLGTIKTANEITIHYSLVLKKK